MTIKKTGVLVALVLVGKLIQAQSWTELLQQPGKNFYEIQAAANEYFKTKDITQPGIGYKQFKRWEHHLAPRVYPSGDLSLVSSNFKNFEEFIRQNTAGHRSSSTAAVGTWTAVGPMGAPSGLVYGVPTKTGRDNFVTFHPTNVGTYWCGAASGGLWKTTNNGATWSTNTDYLTVIGCSDLAIDPTNTNIMYLATGDGEASANYRASIGVLKSIDGGLTWNASGLVYAESQQRQIRRLILNPSNTQVLIAVTNAGVYRSSNAGTTWSLSVSGNFYDAEFKPGDPNTVYLGGNTSFRLSTDGGVTFTTISNGIPSSGANRVSVAVTPADPNYVYVLRSSSSTSGYAGVYRSTSSGTSFSVMSTSPNILANPCNASGTDGIGWYALAFAVSPLDKNEVVAGSVNVWRSLNGGSTWANYGCWNASGTNPTFVHADHHELEYTTSGILYSANDGGIAERTGSTWTDHTAPRNISEIYKLGISNLSANLWITGHQDNGTSIYNSGNYVYTWGGDGMDCFIDRTNDLNMFCSSQNGAFRRSNNGGVSWAGFTSGMSGNAPWVSPWKQDPVNSGLYYAGYSQMFVSSGGAWTQLTNTGGSGEIVEFAIAPSNNQVIYVIHGTSIRKTTNAGTTWTNISSGIPGSTAAPTFITIDPNDENTAWVTCSGYSAANKVFRTNNGGTTWVNITSNLPNLPANCSVYQTGTNDRIYVGMDVGVYTRDNSSTSWTLLNTSLPNVPIFDMEISAAAPNLLRAATFGRGVYETELVQATTAPTSSFVVTGTICSGVSKTFTDFSTEAPSSWAWTIIPSAGVLISSNTDQNPILTFPSGGIYTVSLIASNNLGAGSTITKTIQVAASPVLTLSSSGSSQTVCVEEDITLSANGANTYTWLPNASTGSTLNFIANFSISPTYTVNAKSLEGCTGSETISVIVSECTGIDLNLRENDLVEVFPNPAANYITLKLRHHQTTELQLSILDVSGKQVMQQTLQFKKDKIEQQLSISQLANGIYLLKLSSVDGGVHYLKLVKE